MTTTPESPEESIGDLDAEDNGFVIDEIIPVFGSDTIHDFDSAGAWIQVQLVDRDDEWIDEEVYIDSPSPGGEVADVMEVVAEGKELENDQVQAARQRTLELLTLMLSLDPNAVLSLIWVDRWSDDSMAFHEQVCSFLGVSVDDWFYENHTPTDAEMVNEDVEAMPDSWYTYEAPVTPEILARYADLVVAEGFPSEEWHFTDSRLFSLDRGMYVNAVDANGAVVFAVDEADLAPFRERFGDRIVNSSDVTVEEE